MKRRKFLKTAMILLATSVVSNPFTSFAYSASDHGEETALSEEDLKKQREEYDSHFTYGKENNYFKTDEDFTAYFDNVKKLIAKDPDSPSQFIALNRFITFGGATKAQVKQILDEGYLTENIDKYKEAGLLDENYELPEGVRITKTIEPKTTDENGKPIEPISSFSLTHEVESFDDEAIVALSRLLADDNPDDAYMTITNAKDSPKLLSAGLVTTSGYNVEPITLTFKDDEGETDYTWVFDHQILGNPYQDLDVNMVREDKKISFDLGVELPQPVMLSFRVDKPDTEYYVTDVNTGKKQTLKSSSDSMLTIWDTDSKGVYTYRESSDDGKTKSNSFTKTKITQETKKPSAISNLVLRAAIIFGFVTGLFLIIWGKERR